MNKMLLLVLALCLPACAFVVAPTTFHPLVRGDAAWEGYQDIRIDSDTYKVVYWWNELTTESLGQDLLLYRCATLTTERGFDYFTVIENGRGFRVIRLFHGKRPDDASASFDAREVAHLVGRRLGASELNAGAANAQR